MKNIEIKRAAIMGGTFDPIHYGHLLAAERVREELNLDCIFFIPSGNPPHKDYDGMASSVHRYNMVECAVTSNPFFKILDIEINRDGYSYTIDTVNQLIELMGSRCKLYFIIGADNAGDILNWKNARELITKIEFIAVTRPGQWEEKLKYNVSVLRDEGCSIEVLEMPLVPITSTEIRKRVKNNKSVRYLVPEEVGKYIYKNNLYKS